MINPTAHNELDKFFYTSDYVFGVNNFENTITSENRVMNMISKPRYVRYTMESLKKRSTQRLAVMHNNLFGKVLDRTSMITNLYNKLNAMWNMFEGTSGIARKIDRFGIPYFEGVEPAKKPVGRPAAFESEQQVVKLYSEYLNGLTLNQISKKYSVNICTLSQTFNGKGKYATWLFGDESEMEYYQ